MDLMLEGKTAIVTGGASNIGRDVVRTMVAEGANVAIFDLDEAAAGRVAQEAAAAEAGSARPYRTDVGDPEQVDRSVRRVMQDLGQVHILANVAGWEVDEPFLEETREKQEKVVRINMWGPINMFRAVLPHMVEHQYGRIVSVGSDAARIGEFREGIYACAKAGIIALSKTLSREVGRYNITLNSLCPGLTIPDPEVMSAESFWHQNLNFWTPERQEKAARAYPLRRLGRPEDMANMLVFLVSDRCSYVTGQTISVSGGYSMV